MPSSLGRVLVVDDDPRVAATLRDLLVELGYIVKLAVRGAEALKLVPVFEPDVVLLDLMMPEMSGVEVLDHVRRDRPTLRVVILTGNEDVEVARATLRAGAFDYLGKPDDVLEQRKEEIADRPRCPVPGGAGDRAGQELGAAQTTLDDHRPSGFLRSPGAAALCPPPTAA